MTVVALGAPGVYPAPVASGPPPGEPVRLDVAGIVGIAPRGPVDEPVAVQTWAEYVRRFGTPEPACPGRLADAVATFFRQGGARAWVVRVAPAAADPAAVALLRFGPQLTGTVRLAARDEGSWGAGLTARADLVVTGRFPVGAADAGAGRFTPPAGVTVPPGTLLRIGTTPVLSWVTVGEVKAADGSRRPLVSLDRAIPAEATTAEIVTASVTIAAGPGGPPEEHYDGLGLSPEHPRWMAAVLAGESIAVAPAGDWTGRIEPATPDLASAVTVVDNRGRDRYDEITGAAFLDGYPEADPPGDPPHGVDALASVAGELGLILVPDLLFAPATAPPPPEPKPPDPEYRPRFAPCTPPDPPVPPGPPPVPSGILDDDAEILARQLGLAARTGPDRPAIVLLDVPPHLRGSQILAWRAHFDSDRLAAYHPWLRMVRADGTAVVAPPSPFAAGIIAARERRSGVAAGPANELAADAVGVTDVLTDELHGILHRAGVNAFRPERDGVRLLGARTLSTDPAYRQLSVRRLMTWVRLAVTRRLESAVFEANTPALRTSLRLQVTAMLAGLFRAGALNGGSPAEAFFVHCDDDLNPAQVVQQGRLYLEVGVNPSEPVEYLLLRFALAANGVTAGEEIR